MTAIPKKVHLIWIGNDIPPRNRECIATFPRQNPDWEINLWIDANQLLVGERRARVKQHYADKDANPQTKLRERQARVAKRLGSGDDGLGADDQATIAFLTKHLGARGQELTETRLAKYASIAKFCFTNSIRLQTVQKNLTMKDSITSIYRQELAARGSNFGAASDVLRVEILLQYGGVYFDTDVNCIHPLGTIDCEDTHPRFSAVSTIWKNQPPTEHDWNDDDWWQNTVTQQDPPAISNSIIACGAQCDGLKTYRKLIKQNYKGLKTDKTMRDDYFNNMRGSTIKMTGPTAATIGSGFGDVKGTMGTHRSTQNANTYRADKLFMRDHWYFPMYMVHDQYFHDWLNQG